MNLPRLRGDVEEALCRSGAAEAQQPPDAASDGGRGRRALLLAALRAVLDSTEEGEQHRAEGEGHANHQEEVAPREA